MRTKFLSVKPTNKEDSVSIGFVISFLISFMVILHIFDFGLVLLLWEAFAFVVCYIIFGADRINSMRWILYQMRNSRQTANHKDTYYLGDDFFKVESFKGTVDPEDNSPE